MMPFTSEVVHCAFKTVYGLHHHMNRRVQELLGGFRVEVLDQLGGFFDVGIQHRDLFAFAFQGAARDEDLLG
jgi:hypothetical protein